MTPAIYMLIVFIIIGLCAIGHFGKIKPLQYLETGFIFLVGIAWVGVIAWVVYGYATGVY